MQCFYQLARKTRVGKGNPNFRSGIWSKNGIYKRGSKAVGAHNRACVAYKKNFLKSNDYLRCEVCGVTSAFKFDAHHIRYASRHPGHQNLHNFRNMILVCRDCHLAFHGGRLKDVVERLEKERDLPGLFKG